MTNNIGYRAKLNQFLGDRISLEQFFINYYKLFGLIEIKLNFELKRSKLYNNFIDNRFSKDNSSLHIDKNFVENFENLEEERDLLGRNFDKRKIFVTHMPSSIINKEYLKNLMYLSKKINSSNMLLLENPVMSCEISCLLENYIRLMNLINEKNITNVGFCLDFGHLLQDLNEQGVDQETALKQFLKLNIKRLLFEIHLHDIKGKQDHVPFKDKNKNLEAFSRFYNVLDKKVPIILETNITDIKTEGVKQLRLVKERINENN